MRRATRSPSRAVSVAERAERACRPARSQRGCGGCVTVGPEVLEVRGDARRAESVTRRTSAATARPQRKTSEKCEQDHGFLDLDIDDLADGEPSGGEHRDADDDAHHAERAADERIEVPGPRDEEERCQATRARP